LVAYRPVWILDEPTAALDASADGLFAGLIERHRKQAASWLQRPISRLGWLRGNCG
jgi:heme exporter protein A